MGPLFERRTTAPAHVPEVAWKIWGDQLQVNFCESAYPFPASQHFASPLPPLAAQRSPSLTNIKTQPVQMYPKTSKAASYICESEFVT
jgi:hypothetical protein